MKKFATIFTLLCTAAFAQQTAVFTDTRDGKTYKIAKIGEQTWMAENLNYEAKGSVCYGNNQANCKKYGKLYDWNAAVEVCPKGWHLPSNDEWNTLMDLAGDKMVAGNVLKASSGWENNGNGMDDYGFAALPGGERGLNGNFVLAGSDGLWWSRTEHENSNAYIYGMNAKVKVYHDNYGKGYLFSVRCLQDPKRKNLSKFFAGGEGTKENPYIINTKEHLKNFSTLVNGGDYFENEVVKLGANIMLNDTANWKKWGQNPPINSWVPIGGEGNEQGAVTFKGTFDGDGHIVGGVYINSTKDRQGFFGYLDSSAEVKNLGIVASYVKGEDIVGGLVGGNGDTFQNKNDDLYHHEKGCNISNSYFIGTVMGKISVGGLVGVNYGGVSNGHSAGTVKGNMYVSGLVGLNNFGFINNSHSSSTVIGSEHAGGLVGENGGIVVNSHYTGNISGEYAIGGLVGYNNDSIFNSYSAAVVKGDRNVGGLVGLNSSGVISNSYSKSAVKGNSRTGGLTGRMNCSIIINSYSNGLVTGGKDQVNGMVGFKNKEECTHSGTGAAIRTFYDKQTSQRSDKCKNAAKTSAEMKRKSTYAGWNFEKIWAIDPKINNGYPYLLGNDYIEIYEFTEDYDKDTCPRP